MAPVKATLSVRVNKVAILFLTVVAFVLGILPANLVLNRLDSMMFFAIDSLIAAALSILFFKSLATEKPSISEYLMGWLGAIFWGVFTSLILLFFYLIFLGGASLFGLIAGWLGYNMQIDGDFVAFMISLVITLVFCFVFAAYSADNIAGQLYPNRARVKSVFYELVTFERRRLARYGVAALCFLGVIFLAVFFIAGSFTVWWFGLVLLVYLFFVSASAGLTGETIDPSLPKAIRAVGKLFNAKGYEVVPSPTTGNPEYDPLLVGLDFFVQNKEHALAVVVRTEGPQPEDRWEPSDLLRSTWALQLFLQQEPGVTHNSVIPVIVSIGKERTWEEKEVKIMNIPNKELIDKVLAMNSKEDMKELKEIASQCLQFSHEGEDLNAPKDNLNVPGEEI